jgi:putative ABC transport system permease protein
MKVFKRLVEIAWRNIFRNKRRSLLTLLILILGSGGLIIVGGFFQGMLSEFREVFIHSQTGHIQVNVKGYYEKGASAPFEYLIQNVAELQKEIESVPHVLYTVPHLKFSGMASSENTSIAVLALGVDPILESRMANYQTSRAKNQSTKILEGEDLQASDLYGAALGKGLKQAMALKLGDPFNFITTRQAGAIDGAEYHPVGAFETFIKDFDDRAMKVNLESAQKLLNLPNQVHSLLVLLDETKNTEAVKAKLEDLFKTKGLKLEAITWEEQGQFYRQSKDLLSKIYTIIQFIMTVIFFFSIANTINMALFERMREFGTMMAIGNSRMTVFMMIFLEAAILGIVGSLLGLLVGSIGAQILSAVGIEMPPPPQGSSNYIATFVLNPSLLFQTFLLSMGSALLSSLLPAHRASHLPIIHALGYV